MDIELVPAPAAAAAASSSSFAQPPPLQAGVINLGGQYNPATMLDPRGRDPLLPNSLPTDTYNQRYMIMRVAEVLELFDNPLYSFMSGVQEMTRAEMRTTQLVGVDAVRELFGLSGTRQDMYQLHTALPNTVNDRERDRADKDGRVVQSDTLQQVALPKAAAAAPAKPVAKPAPPSGTWRGDARAFTTGVVDYPRVGKVGADPDAAEEEEGQVSSIVARKTAKPAAPTPSPLSSSFRPARSLGGSLITPVAASAPPPPTASLARVDVDDAVPLPPPGAPPINVSQLPHSTVAEGTAEQLRRHDVVMHTWAHPTGKLTADGKPVLHAPIDHPELNIRLKDGTYRYNITDGKAVAISRLANGEPLTEADFKTLMLVYGDGVGVTKPMPSVARTQTLNARQTHQRRLIEEFAANVHSPADLAWALFPEHLRVLFLTSEAQEMLEQATWLAHYQQPWDGSMTVTRSRFTARETVPVIDLMTHEMTRTPFKALVANVILYWRARRANDRAKPDDQVQAILVAINSNVLTLREMDYGPDGFLSIRGHYDPVAKRTRAQIEQRRLQYNRDTGGAFWSDLDSSVYSRGVTRLAPTQPAQPAGFNPLTSAAAAMAVETSADRRNQMHEMQKLIRFASPFLSARNGGTM